MIEDRDTAQIAANQLENDNDMKKGNQQVERKDVNVNLDNKGREVSLDTEEEEEEQLLSEMLNKKGDKMNLSAWDYYSSFIYKPKALKVKLKLFNEGIENINDRMQIENLMKKMREFDKLRALLLDQNQLILFNNLPKPEIPSADNNENKLRRKTSAVQKEIARPSFKEEKRTVQEIIDSYRRIQRKSQKTDIDQKLLELFGKTTD